MTEEIQTTADALEQAKAALLNAENKHGELSRNLQRAKDDAASSRKKAHELAYSAIDDDSSKRLANKLLADATRLDEESAHRISPAVAQAAKYVEAARAAVTDEAERINAGKALERLETFAKRGAALDEKFDEAIAEYQRLTQDFNELNALGYAPTTFDLVKVLMQAAAVTKLQFTDLRVAFLAPHERRNFVTVIEAWSAAVRGKATARLNRTKPAEKQQGKAA